MAQVPSYDNDIIWVFNLSLTTEVYLATEDITLSGTLFDGKVLKISQFEETFQDGEINYTGGISVLGNLLLRISAETDNVSFSSWFNGFYPNTSIYLINRFVRMGIVWKGATSTSQITWLHELKIIDYSYADNGTDLSLDMNNEFVDINIPYFKTQNIYDDGISYVENITDEKDQIIPAIYGDLSTSYLSQAMLNNEGIRLLGKSIMMDKSSLLYKYAYHPCYAIEPYGQMFKYIDGCKNFLVMTAEAYLQTNNQTGASTELNPSTRTYGERITGVLPLTNFAVGSQSDINDINELLDLEYNYIVIPSGERLAITIDGNVSSSDTGLLNPLDSSIFNLEITAMSNTGVAGQITLGYYSDRGFSTGYVKAISASTATRYSCSLGTDVSAKPNASLPWTVEEVCGIECSIHNTGSQAVRLYRAGIYLSDINIQQYYSTYKGNKVSIKVKR